MAATSPEPAPATKTLSHDDRGKPIRVLDIHLLPDEDSELQEELIDAALADLSSLQSKVTISWWQGVLVVSPLLVFLLLVMIWPTVVLDNLKWFLLSALLLPALLGASVVNRLAEGSSDRSLTHRLVEAGFCGQCCYPLDRIPPQADGCTVCPECGAAWRATR